MAPEITPPNDPQAVSRPDPGASRNARTAHRLIAILVGLVVAQGIAIVRLLLRPTPPAGFATAEEIARRFETENAVARAHPGVDFTRIYPGWTPADIDLLQRETSTLRYAYAPFVEFRQLPVKRRFVEVTPAGFRVGLGPQPWPPEKDDFVVFVFGGSTTFGFNVPNDQTVVAHLQRELSARHPALRVQCYNFGAIAYLSSQERALFEILLLRGVVPDCAIFIDGLNDFYFADGNPQLTPILFRFVTPDLALPGLSIRGEQDKQRYVDALLDRYRRNVGLIEAIAEKHGVKALFIGQPTPFLDFPRNQDTYPFEVSSGGWELCAWGYHRFGELAATGALGPRFLWCGDAFSDARTIMFVDGGHYSSEGARVLAAAIVDRAATKGLLP